MLLSNARVTWPARSRLDGNGVRQHYFTVGKPPILVVSSTNHNTHTLDIFNGDKTQKILPNILGDALTHRQRPGEYFWISALTENQFFNDFFFFVGSTSVYHKTTQASLMWISPFKDLAYIYLNHAWKARFPFWIIYSTKGIQSSSPRTSHYSIWVTVKT